MRTGGADVLRSTRNPDVMSTTPSVRRWRSPELLREPKLLDLARRCGRELVDGAPAPRHLESGERVACVCLEFAPCRRVSGVEPDDGAHLLTPVFVGHSEHGDVAD